MVPENLMEMAERADEQIAALKAENETLREDNKVLQTEACRAWGLLKETAERALAERAGGVKVLREVDFTLVLRDDAVSLWCGSSDDAQRIYSTLEALTTEPAAPEGQQEPVATVAKVNAAGTSWNTVYPADALDKLPIGTPLYTRPSEQAVTEAAGPFVTFANHAVEKTDDGWVWRTSSNERICDWFGPSDFGALKAAMEAGR